MANGRVDTISAKITFWFSETPNGENVSEEKDEEHTLELTQLISSWTEYHPFGSTVAGEHMSEPIYDSDELFLDGDKVDFDTLAARFGKDWADKIVVQLTDELE